MKEFYLKREIPVWWEEKVRDELVEAMKKKLPDDSTIRYEGYLSMDSNDFVIIYTVGE